MAFTFFKKNSSARQNPSGTSGVVAEAVAAPAVQQQAAAASAAPAAPAVPSVKIAVVFHSIHHHIHRLAVQVKQGIESVPGATATLYRVPETLSGEVLEKMHAAPELSDIPLATPEDLAAADGIIFGIPSRFGHASAQIRAFIDSLGGLWAAGALAGKHGAVFFSSAQQTGGQETVAFTLLPFFAHHGINFVPLGYRHKGLFQIDEITGGSAWGAGTVTGHGVSIEVRPTALELDMASTHGQIFADTILTSAAGKALREHAEKTAAAATKH